MKTGADDYITKPFSVIELIARIKALLRRAEGDDTENKLVFKNIGLDANRHTVSVDGKEVLLTAKEFQLLSCLMSNAHIVLSREKLMNMVWGFDYEGESRTVDMHVKTLRQKLGEAGNHIITVRGVGYKIGG